MENVFKKIKSKVALGTGLLLATSLSSGCLFNDYDLIGLGMQAASFNRGLSFKQRQLLNLGGGFARELGARKHFQDEQRNYSEGYGNYMIAESIYDKRYKKWKNIFINPTFGIKRVWYTDKPYYR